VLESCVVDEVLGVLAVELDALTVVLVFDDTVDDVAEDLFKVDCEVVAL